MKYSIIMPHWERAELLRHTLQSFAFHYAGRNDWEVVIVEDSKNTDNVREVVALFVGMPIVVVRTGRDDGYNPATAFNVGVNAARGQYVVLTNPECLHFTPVLQQLDTLFAEQPHVYVVCACESIKDSGDFKRPDTFKYRHHMWYQHTQHRNECLHFCTALRRDLFLGFDGFDERYSEGIAYEDNSFRDRVKRAGIPFVVRDDIVVLHQWHDKISGIVPRQLDRELRSRNRQLYQAECAA
jgi:GT2 family glycosyltransferase